jgi:hypothetical protein
MRAGAKIFAKERAILKLRFLEDFRFLVFRVIFSPSWVING